MADLVSGRYPQQEYWWSLLGRPTNATQSDIPIRSNLAYLGVTAAVVDQAQAATKKGWFVAIPVSEGDSFSKVGILVGATKSASNPQAVAAIYTGTTGAVEATLIAQSSKAAGETVMTAETFYQLELEKSVLVSPATAPNGFVYAGIAQESGEIATAIGTTTPKAVTNKVLIKAFNAPPSFACAMTVAGAGEASAKLKVATAVETAPLIFLQ